jgi:hypothetical protein
MLRKAAPAFVAVALVTFAAAPAFAQKITGNGSESGSHYTLNIIGMEKEKQADLTGSYRHTIFVDIDYSDATPKSPTPLASLNPKNKIFLEEGPFRVIDGNAWDGAVFQLPAPDCEGLTVSATNLDCDYRVYVRGLGSPQNNPSAQITTCAIDDAGTPGTTADDTFQCSTETVTVSRNKGKSSFTNVTKQLLTACMDTFDDGNFDGLCDERVELFDEDFYQYFWDYDNNGLRLAQLRFYPLKP